MKLENLTIVTCKIVAEVGAFIRDEFKNFDKNKVEIKVLPRTIRVASDVMFG